MKRALHITDGATTLPVVMLTDSTTIFGRKRTGKSNNAVVLVEEALDLKAQVVIFDPKGDWWGLTSSFDGKRAGYPLVVIGGLHATPDVGALNVYAGATVAEWVLDTGYSVIVDLSQLKDPDRERFLAPFIETVRRRKTAQPGPILVVIDEADELAPQDERERAHVMDTYRGVVWMVKRGGFAGIGTLVITQRPASLSKNVTTQSETIVTLQVGGSQDLDAVAAALKHHVEGDTPRARAAALDDLLREVVHLDKGATVIVSAAQGLRGTIHRIQFRRRRTFDSGATPEFGKTVRPPKVVATVDLARLSSAMQKAVAEAKANDPGTLRAQLAAKDLRIRQLEAATPPPAAPAKTVKVPALTAADRKRLEKVPDQIDRAAANLYRVLEGIADFRGALDAAAEITVRVRALLDPHLVEAAKAAAVRSTAPVAPTPISPPRDARGSAGPARSTRSEPPPVSAGGMKAGKQRILDALAWLACVGMTAPRREAVAALAKIRPTSGSYSVTLRELKDEGFISYPSAGVLSLTNKGATWSTAPQTPPTSRDLHEAIYAKLPAAHSAILRELVRIYPGEISRPELAERIGVSPTSGSYSVNLADLNGYGFVVYPGGGRVAAAPLLFLEGAA